MEIFRKIFQDKKNYYNIIVIIFTGVLLLITSGEFFKKDKSLESSLSKEETSMNNDLQNESDLEKRLANILEKVEGVGAVNVMITFSSGKEIITKDNISKENSKVLENAQNGDARQTSSEKVQTDTVKINGDTPLILKEISPKISGVLIVAQGGGNIQVKNNLINATKALLDIEIHKIEVLKMK